MFGSLIRRKETRLPNPEDGTFDSTTFTLSTAVPRPVERRNDERIAPTLRVAKLEGPNGEQLIRVRNVSAGGLMAEAGPRGTLDLRALSGNLRGRPVRGQGNIDFAAPAKLAGDLALSSGRSRVSVKGTSGEGQRIHATVDLGVESLNDWLPDTTGSLTGRFLVRGVWPKLTIDGSADGRALGFTPKDAGEGEGHKRHQNNRRSVMFARFTLHFYFLLYAMPYSDFNHKRFEWREPPSNLSTRLHVSHSV